MGRGGLGLASDGLAQNETVGGFDALVVSDDCLSGFKTVVGIKTHGVIVADLHVYVHIDNVGAQRGSARVVEDVCHELIPDAPLAVRG